LIIGNSRPLVHSFEAVEKGYHFPLDQYRTAKRIVHEPAEFILRVQSCRRSQDVPPKNNERLYNHEIRPTFVTFLRLNVRAAWTPSNEREIQHTTRNSQGG